MNIFDLNAASMFDFANMTPYELGRNVLLPFLLVFVVFWAVLDKIHVFSRKVNIIISLGISVILATTPIFTMFTQYITQVGGTGMIVIFGVLLVGATLLWATGRGRDVYYEHVDDIKKIERLEKRRADLLKKAESEKSKGHDAKAIAYVNAAKEVKDRIELAKAGGH